MKSFAAVVHVPGGVGGGHLSKVKGIHRPIGVPYHHKTTPGGGEGRREMGKEGGKQRGEGKGGGEGREGREERGGKRGEGREVREREEEMGG